MFRRKPAPHLMRGGRRFADKNMRQIQLAPRELDDVPGADAQSARHRLAAPGARLAVDPVEIVGGGLDMLPVERRGRCRRHADRRDRAGRSGEPIERLDVIVAVQHQLGAASREHLAQRRRIGQMLELAAARAAGRMVDQDHAAAIGEAREQRVEARDLLRAEPAGGEKRRGRHRAREADQRERPAPAHEGKAQVGGIRRVVAHELPPGRVRGERLAHIGVVIAGHQRHVVRRAERVQPRARRRVFRQQPDIDEVAGDRDVVGRLRVQVAHQELDPLGAVDPVPGVPPMQIAEHALVGELAQPRPRQRREMRVGEMSENEHGR